MLRRRSKEVISVSKRAEGSLLKLLGETHKGGVISTESMMVYINIITGASMLFNYIVSRSSFAKHLARIGLGDSDAATFAFFYMICSIFWDYSVAFRSDAALGERIGKDFSEFAADFSQVTDLGDMIHQVLEFSEAIYQTDGGGIDFRPVMDQQTAVFLQTITDGRFTAAHLDAHLRGRGFAERFALAGTIYRERLRIIRTLKTAWGLERPVF